MTTIRNLLLIDGDLSHTDMFRETLLNTSGGQTHACDEGQGYYFGRPMPAEQFAGVLETGVLAAAVS